jgi:DNA polymerase-1
MNQQAYKLFHAGTLAFADMEQNGIRVDLQYCKTQKKEIERQIKTLERELDKTEELKTWRKRYKEDFNLDSNHQLSKILYENFKIESPREDGKLSVDKDTLYLIDSPIVAPIIQLRQLKKVSNTYLKNIIDGTINGYLHPSFNLNTVQTYRSSSDKPNFQNMPIRDPVMGKIIRQSFIPREGGMIGGFDYLGIELLMAGCNSKDPSLIEDFTTIHKTQAAKCYALKESQVTKDVRYCGKNKFVFPELYGDWYENCAVNLMSAIKEMELKTKDGIGLQRHLIKQGLGNWKTFQDHIKRVELVFWSTYHIHKKWQEKWIADYNRKGFIEILTGFRCKGIMSKNQLLNYANQGIAFHCLLWSIIQMNKWLKKYKMKSRLIWNIHDDMGMDINIKEKEDVFQMAKQIMCIDIKKVWKWIITPLEIEAEFSEINWYEKKEIKI